VTDENADRAAQLIKDEGLEVAAVDASLFNRYFKHGAFTNPDPKMRRDAIEVAKRTVDMAERLGTPYAGIWLGQDGYDYLFQRNYDELWKLELDAMAEVAAHNPRIKICIEYKIREPRYYMTIGSVGKSLHMCNVIGAENLGVTLDIGHCLMGRENPAESASLLMQNGKLFSAHFNDAYGVDDDDMIAGSLHIWQTLELIVYLEDGGYDGWWGLDYFPYREDISRAAAISIANIKALREWAKQIDRTKLRELQRSGDATETQQYLHELFLAPQPVPAGR
jgi:xylose isomerase